MPSIIPGILPLPRLWPMRLIVERMRDMERELIEKFNLPDSLIVRVESN